MSPKSDESAREELSSLDQLKPLLSKYATDVFEFCRDMEKNVKQLSLSIVHQEGQESKVNRQLVQIQKKIKELEEEKGGSGVQFDMASLGSGSMDTSAILDAMQGLKKDLAKKFVSKEDFDEKIEETLEKLNSNFGKDEILELMDKVDKKIKEVKSSQKEFEYSLEDVSDRQAKQKRMLEGKLDAVFFDEELEEIK